MLCRRQKALINGCICGCNLETSPSPSTSAGSNNYLFYHSGTQKCSDLSYKIKETDTGQESATWVSL